MKYGLMIGIIFGFSFDCHTQYLDQFLWENRLIIIFENKAQLSEKGDIQERTLLRNKAILKEQKLRVFRYNGSTLKTVFPQNKLELNIDLDLPFREDYEFLLIGLDGTIKTRFSDVKSPRWIFDLIDSMPMRQKELKLEKNNKK